MSYKLWVVPFLVASALFQQTTYASDCTKFIDNIEDSSTLSEGYYQTLNDALIDFIPGDIVCFMSGTYQRISITDFEGGELGLTIKPHDVNKTFVINADYSGSGILITNSSNIRVEGFNISGGLYGIYARGTSDLTLSSNHIFNVGQEGIMIKSGISTQTLSNFMVMDNIISDTGKGRSQYGEGIYIGDGNDNFNEILHNITLKNNRISNVTNEAIEIKINTNNVYILENTIIDTDLKFNGAITIATSDRLGDDSNIIIYNNTIKGVTNRSGYRPIGIAVGQGDISIIDNDIEESNSSFVGICLFTTFVNTDANTVTLGGNSVVTDGRAILEKCGNGGTGVDAPANVNYL